MKPFFECRFYLSSNLGRNGEIGSKPNCSDDN